MTDAAFVNGVMARSLCQIMKSNYALLPFSKTWSAAFFLCMLPSFLLDAQLKAVDSNQNRTVLRRMEQQEREYRKRAYPLLDIPQGAQRRALDEIQKASKSTSAALMAGGGGFRWFNIGPAPIYDATSPDSCGRVSAIAVDPGDPYHWLLGAAQGGVWESKDGGGSWFPRSDDQPSLAIGALRFAPSNPQIVYAGTGEANFARISYAGMGLLKSLDGGATWFLVASAPFAETAFSEIKVNSSNPNILVAATARGVLGQVSAGTNLPPTAPTRGIFISNNGGSNWVHTLFGEATDVEIDPANFNRQYAALGEIFGAPTNGVYRSTDGGVSWSRINGPWTSTADFGRIEMSMVPTIPNRLYVSVAENRDVGGLVGIWRTDNAWAATPTWTLISSSSNPAPQPFAWYSHDLLVHPGNPDVVYFAGLTVWRFDGSTWQNLPNQHPDQHVLAWVPTFDPSIFRLIAGHDGGISSRLDNSGSWSSHLKNLSITQFYKGAVDPNDSSIILGGSQDNGTEVYNGNPSWKVVRGGDGFSCAIAASQSANNWAVSHQQSSGLSIFRTTDGGKNLTSASFGIDSSTISFFIDFEKHPGNDDIFVAGAINLWRCENFFSATTPSWNANSPVLQKSDGTDAEITAIAFAPSDALGRIYAYGTEDGQLRITTQGGGGWADLDAGDAVPGRYISGIAFSPSNPQEIYVTLSGFDEGTLGHPGHVFRTTNALASNSTWLNVSPPANLPIDCIAINPTDASSIFVGADFGVWTSSNSGQTWNHLGPLAGMPNVAVFDLRFDKTGMLTAFTHGRGAFMYRQLPVIIPPLCKISSCFDPWINPEDLITITLPLRNVLPIEPVELTVRLRTTSQIVPVSGSGVVQSYGKLSSGSGTIARPFQFRAKPGTGGGRAFAPAAGGCGGMVEAIFDLEDSGQPLGSIIIPLHLGQLNQPLLDDFEGVAQPSLPFRWFSRPGEGPSAWASTSNAPPNVLGGEPEEPGEDVNDDIGGLTGPVSVSAFAPDLDRSSDSSLYSPFIPIATDRAQLTFRHSFDVEPNFDGAVLEIAIGTQPFVDIMEAGGTFPANGYNAAIAAANTALAGRRAWSGDSGGWLITVVNLPPAATQQVIQLRWRLASDASIGRDGWFIDDVAIDEYQCVPPVVDPVILRPGRYENSFGFFINTVPARTFYVEYKDTLDEPAWHLLRELQGDGADQFVIDPTRGPAQRFYRFRVK